jgi:ATP-binding cassette subfamily B protein
VQQVQMLVLMTCTLLISAPIFAIGGVVMALQQDLELSWLMVVAIPVLPRFNQWMQHQLVESG